MLHCWQIAVDLPSFFVPPPPTGGIWQLKSPQPREFAIQGRKKLCPGVGGLFWGGGLGAAAIDQT